jgi:steroid 5-alpha reductase family enzyme
LSPFVGTFVFVVLYVLALWVASVRRRDASIVDIAWGPGFAGIALVTYALVDGYGPRQLLVTALAMLWGARLGGYLLWRAWGGPEDYRYQAMRRRHGDRFPLVSLYTVFGLQGAIMWVVSLPIQVAQIAPGPPLGALDAAGGVLFAIGFLFESVGDWQVARFKSDPTKAGKVLDRGLWRYTRHPNYFGDFLVHWGIFVIALATTWGWATVLSPLFMTFLLLRVSGVAMLEQTIGRRRPEYAEYQRRTSAFFPRPPRT